MCTHFLKVVAFAFILVSLSAAVWAGKGKVCCEVAADTDVDRPAGGCQACICRPHTGSCEEECDGATYTVNHYAEKRFTLAFIGCVTDPDSCCKSASEMVNCSYHNHYGDMFNPATEDPICSTVVCEMEYGEAHTCESENCPT